MDINESPDLLTSNSNEKNEIKGLEDLLKTEDNENVANNPENNQEDQHINQSIDINNQNDNKENQLKEQQNLDNEEGQNQDEENGDEKEGENESENNEYNTDKNISEKQNNKIDNYNNKYENEKDDIKLNINQIADKQNNEIFDANDIFDNKHNKKTNSKSKTKDLLSELSSKFGTKIKGNLLNNNSNDKYNNKLNELNNSIEKRYNELKTKFYNQKSKSPVTNQRTLFTTFDSPIYNSNSMAKSINSKQLRSEKIDDIFSIINSINTKSPRNNNLAATFDYKSCINKNRQTLLSLDRPKNYNQINNNSFWNSHNNFLTSFNNKSPKGNATISYGLPKYEDVFRNFTFMNKYDYNKKNLNGNDKLKGIFNNNLLSNLNKKKDKDNSKSPSAYYNLVKTFVQMKMPQFSDKKNERKKTVNLCNIDFKINVNNRRNNYYAKKDFYKTKLSDFNNKLFGDSLHGNYISKKKTNVLDFC